MDNVFGCRCGSRIHLPFLFLDSNSSLSGQMVELDATTCAVKRRRQTAIEKRDERAQESEL